MFGAEEVPKKEPDSDSTENIVTASMIQSNPSKYYGSSVKYESEKGKNYEWQIFHADDGGIYLITKDYIKIEDIPNIGNYPNGSEDVKENMKNLNSSFFIDKGYTSMFLNMQTVAYMLDTDAWGKYADDKANYAIGGPSLELLCKSYNAYKGSEILYCEAVQDGSNYGYKISKNGEGLLYLVNVFETTDAKGMYTIQAIGDIDGYWLASPAANHTDYGMLVGYGDVTCWAIVSIEGDNYSFTNLGFRPLVYLKTGIVLEELENNTFIVK